MSFFNSESSVNELFDELKRRRDDLLDHPKHDNEATRHDRLVVPFLSHPRLLGWHHSDLVSQASITVPKELLTSHIFRGAAPKSRKPDILVMSSIFEFNALVVEEKARQASMDELNGNRFQIHEYQALYECVWGLLTDGERWILKKNLESFHSFDSLDELQAGLVDIRHCIGKKELLKRKLDYGTCDLLMVIPNSRFLRERNFSNVSDPKLRQLIEFLKEHNPKAMDCLEVRQKQILMRVAIANTPRIESILSQINAGLCGGRNHQNIIINGGVGPGVCVPSIDAEPHTTYSLSFADRFYAEVLQ